MIPVMRAIDYNTLMSVIDFIGTEAPKISADYGLAGLSVPIYPSYPKDITKLVKPSIIVQRVHVNTDKIGFGNFLGQYEDIATGTTYDVNGRIHKMSYQISVEGNSTTQSSLLSALLTEGIFERVVDPESGLEIKLGDYIADMDNPTEMGTIQIINNIDSVPLESNDNSDYIIAVHVDFMVLQTIIPDSDIVDLTKPIKFTQVITL